MAHWKPQGGGGLRESGGLSWTGSVGVRSQVYCHAWGGRQGRDRRHLCRPHGGGSWPTLQWRERCGYGRPGGVTSAPCLVGNRPPQPSPFPTREAPIQYTFRSTPAQGLRRDVRWGGWRGRGFWVAGRLAGSARAAPEMSGGASTPLQKTLCRGCIRFRCRHTTHVGTKPTRGAPRSIRLCLVSVSLHQGATADGCKDCCQAEDILATIVMLPA